MSREVSRCARNAWSGMIDLRGRAGMRMATAGIRSIVLLVALACVPQICRGDDPPQQSGSAADEAAIRQASQTYREAVAAGDLAGVASLWAPQADYVDQWGHAYKIDARLARAKQLAKQDEAGHIGHPPLKVQTLSIRFLTPEVAIEDGLYELPTAESQAQARFAAVWVKHDGQWLLESVRESAYRHTPQRDELQDLDWMIGDWTATAPDLQLEVSCTWGPEKSYVLRQIKIEAKNEEPVSVTQWIGWDPAQHRIRSFSYDSRGGHGEGVWTKEGEAWVANTTGVLPTGRRTSATNLYSRVDDNTAIWESIDDEADGQPGVDLRMRATRRANKEE